MGGVFLSYRRADSAHALLLFHRLAEEFGHNAVFLDLQDIAPAQDFVQRIDKALRKATALVALIGSGWKASLERLRMPGDFVAREIGQALKRAKHVLPVLAGGTTMPPAEELPASLAALAHINGLVLSDELFQEDLDRVVLALSEWVPPAPDATALPARPTIGREDARFRLLDLLQRIQFDCIALIEAGELDKALEGLYRGMGLMMAQLQAAPSDAELQLQLGYMYKDVGAAFQAASQENLARQYWHLAASLFQRIVKTAKSENIRAGALNLIGNIQYYFGEFERAAEYERKAVELLPSYAYAWHDLYLTSLELQRRGKVTLPALRSILKRLKETAPGNRGLEPERLAQLEALLPRAARATRHRKN